MAPAIPESMATLAIVSFSVAIVALVAWVAIELVWEPVYTAPKAIVASLAAPEPPRPCVCGACDKRQRAAVLVAARRLHS